MTIEELDCIGNAIGIFNHHAYFTDELWRYVEGRKNDDEAEIKNAFLVALLHSIGTNATPCGSAWLVPSSEKDVMEYLSGYQDIFNDYNNWSQKQR